jgi:hypothetical protein
MRRHWKKIVLFLAGIAACVFFAIPDGPPEPEYKGRPLSYWLIQGNPIVDQTYPNVGILEDYLNAFRSPVATEAIQAIGANAIPFYLKWIRYEAPSWRKKLADKFQPRTALSFRIKFWIENNRSDRLAMASGVALAKLGTNATAATPVLATLILHTNTPQTALRAMRALCYLGTNGLQPVISAIRDPQYSLRSVAVLCLSCTTGSEAPGSTAIPVLIECLGDTSLNLQTGGAMGLGRNTSVPALAVPALTGCLSSTNAKVRLYAAASLLNYGSQAISALPALTNALVDSDFKVRAIATNAIVQITSAMLTNAPAK